jgi:cytosine/adenosine deaminase-related metal-dependent hydrolase
MAIHALKARYVFPVSSGPIANGLIGIQGERIAAVGDHVAADTVEDLGNVAILPGLVNAHTHLEFSGLTKPLGEPAVGFADWIRCVIEYRNKAAEILLEQNCLSDTSTPHPNPLPKGEGTFYCHLRAVEKGLKECARYGVTTIGEIAQPDWPGDSLQQHTANGTAFLELIAPTADRVAAALELARMRIEGSGFRVQGSECTSYLSSEPRTLNPEPLNWRIGLSPHAPYSVHVDLLQKIIELSVHRQIPLAMHLAESREEIQWLDDGNGPLKDLLMDLGAYDPAAISRCSRPLDYLEMLAVADRALIIHGNYLSRDEIGLLADHAETMAVVYCPRAHQYFGHDRYPLERMLTAGVTVCLGTDSRASSPDLDLLAEIRHVARLYTDISPRTVLQLGTLQGAKALGRDSEIGSLQTGKYANLAVVPLPRRESDDPYDLLFDSDNPVTATWFRGKRICG